MSKKLSIKKKKKKNTEVKKCMLIFEADQDIETDYDLKGNYNTESRACTKKSYTCKEKAH